MKTLPRSDIPEDFTYYRTGSEAFFEYYKKYTSVLVAKIGKGFEFFKGRRVLGGLWWNIAVEKVDHEMTRGELAKHDISRAVVFWTPKTITKRPRGWWKLPSMFSLFFLHSSRSAFSIVEKEYWNKWSPKARGHRRKVLSLLEDDTLRVRTATISEFLEHYKRVKIRDPHQQFVGRMTEKLFLDNDGKHRVYLAEVGGRVLAGAVFIDMETTSEYWASFYTDESKPYHLGVAMMDRWFADSLEQGIKYCDLDHMWDTGEPTNRIGYTRFKESIADYDVYWRDTWVRFF